jgi:general secretion pathway protein H
MTRARRLRAGRVAGDAAGFTLVELLVALAILAAAVVMVVPVTSTSVSPQLLRSTASQMAALARQTRAAAVRSGTERTLTIDLVARTYWSDGIAPPRRIPSGFAVALSLPGDSSAATGTPRQIRFQPSGGSSGGHIALRQGVRVVSVDIDWLTGGVHVGSPAP